MMAFSMSVLSSSVLFFFLPFLMLYGVSLQLCRSGCRRAGLGTTHPLPPRRWAGRLCWRSPRDRDQGGSEIEGRDWVGHRTTLESEGLRDLWTLDLLLCLGDRSRCESEQTVGDREKCQSLVLQRHGPLYENCWEMLGFARGSLPLVFVSHWAKHHWQGVSAYFPKCLT